MSVKALNLDPNQLFGQQKRNKMHSHAVQICSLSAQMLMDQILTNSTAQRIIIRSLTTGKKMPFRYPLLEIVLLKFFWCFRTYVECLLLVRCFP